MLLNLDRLVRSVDKDDLSTTADELGQAFAGGGTDLQRLIDSGDALTRSPTRALPETTRLIQDGTTVLRTQRASGSDIRSFASDLVGLSGQLVASDDDLRKVLHRGTIASRELDVLLRDNRTELGALLANLVTIGQVTVTRPRGLQQPLVTYPDVIRGGFTVVPGDGTPHFGLQLNVDQPPACRKGYEGTRRIDPNETSSMPPLNRSARCTLPRGSASSVRGAQNAPVPGPGPASSVPLSGPDAASGPDAPTVTNGAPPADGDTLAWMLLGGRP